MGTECPSGARAYHLGCRLERSAADNFVGLTRAQLGYYEVSGAFVRLYRRAFQDGFRILCLTRFNQGFFEHGIFSGIDVVTNYKSMNLNAILGAFTIEWE